MTRATRNGTNACAAVAIIVRQQRLNATPATSGFGRKPESTFLPEESKITMEDAMRFTKAKTKREAVVTAIREFNRRKRMAELTKHAGTCRDLMSVEELLQQRWKG